MVLVPNPVAADVEIVLLGAPRWRSAALAECPLPRRDAALFALLALGGPQPRDRVAAWLWPQVPQRNANLSLRQRLFKLRQMAGHALVDAAGTVQLLPGVGVDVLRAGEPAEAGLLAGHDYSDLEAFDDWLQQARDERQRQHLDALAGHAARLEDQGRVAEAISVCERLVALRPTLEHGWRRLMRLHHARGDRSAAIETFERFEREVCREQGHAPSAETLALLDTVERHDAQVPDAPAALPASLLRPPRLVGRAGELAAIHAAWQAGRVAFVLGVGGIGKSRLIDEAVAGLRGVARVRARPGDAGMPYATAGPLLADLAEQGAAALTAAQRGELARLVPALGPAPASPGQQQVLWQAVDGLLDGAAAHGLGAVVVDDAHFADPASLELLRWLLASPRRGAVKWLLAARADEPGPAHDVIGDWLADSSRTVPVTLSPWSQLQVQELVLSLALPRPLVRDGLAQALFKHAGGHPFFTLETLKRLAEQPGGDSLPLPPAAAAMVDGRLARLAEPPRQLLRLVALAAGLLRPEVAARVLARPLVDVAGAWAELEAAQLTQGTQLVHDIVRERALANWPPPLRQPLLVQLATELSQPGTKAQADPARLAALWWQAEAWPQAAECLQQAAAAARLAGRIDEELALLEQARAAWQHHGDAGRAFDTRIPALRSMLLVHGSAAALQASQDWLPEADSDERRAALHLLRAEARLNNAEFELGLAEARRALDLSPLGGALQADAIALHGRALALTGCGEEAVTVLEQALLRARQLGDDSRALVAASASAHALHASHRHGLATQRQREALRHARQLGDAPQTAQALCNLATLLTYQGDTVGAYAAARDAHDRFQALRLDDAHALQNRITLARAAAHLGLLDEALEVITEACAASREAAGPTLMAMARTVRFGLGLWLGATAPGAAALLRLEAGMHPISQVGVHLAAHRLALIQGRTDDAPARALAALAQAHPALLDDPVLAREWLRLLPAESAVQRLRLLAQRSDAAGASGVVRSLRVVEVERLLEINPAGAAALAEGLRQQLDDGLMPAVYPPQAWWTLARALHAAGRRRPALWCRARALRWIDQARLPTGVDRPGFINRQPVNQAVTRSRWDSAGW